MPESFSVNQLKTWSKCQKKFEFDYVRKLAWPSNPQNFRLGKGVHQLLDYASKGMDLSPILQDADRDIATAWEMLQQSSWAKLPTIASEWGFSLEVQGYWIYGRIDRIVQRDETIHILDWKTGTGIPRCPEADWQTLIYQYAVYEAQRDLQISIDPAQLVFTYVQLKGGAVQEVHIPFSHPIHEKTRQRLLQTITAITSDEAYTLPATCPDKFCPYRKICGIESKEKAIDTQTGMILENMAQEAFDPLEVF